MVDVRSAPPGATLVASIEGSSAIVLDELVAYTTVTESAGQGSTITSPVAGASCPETPHEELGVTEVRLVVVAQAGADEPLPVSPDQHVSGYVRAMIDTAGASGMRKALLQISGPWPVPAEAEIRFMAGDVAIEPLYPPVVLHQDQWAVIPFRVSLPDAMGTEISLTADAPVHETERPTLVMPYNAAVLTSLRLIAPAHSFPTGPAQLQLSVTGLAQSPVRYPLDVQIEPAAPPPEPWPSS